MSHRLFIIFIVLMTGCNSSSTKRDMSVERPADLSTVTVMDGSETDENCKPVVMVQPRYPRRLARHGIGGSVKMLLRVEDDGNVSYVEVIESRPPGGFDVVATKAAQSWKFRPKVVDGKTQATWCILPMTFMPPD